MFQVIYREIAKVNGTTKVNSKTVQLKDEAALALFFGSIQCQNISNLQTFFCCAGQRLLTPIVPDDYQEAGAAL